MTTYAWTLDSSDYSFTPESIALGIRTNSSESVSPMSGDVQSTMLPGNRWAWTINIGEQTWTERRKLMAFLAQLSGRQHRIAFYDLANPTPQGTIALSGIVVNTGGATQWATQIPLKTAAFATLLRGDWVSINGQLFMCTVDTTADSLGNMSPTFANMARAALTSGMAVVTNQPTGLYVLDGTDVATTGNLSSGKKAAPFSFGIVEVFS